jgi:hypothetical protein
MTLVVATDSIFGGSSRPLRYTLSSSTPTPLRDTKIRNNTIYWKAGNGKYMWKGNLNVGDEFELRKTETNPEKDGNVYLNLVCPDTTPAR